MASAPPIPEPDIEDGITYWTTQPASLDGVLGGFGTGSLPRVDALGSRQFLLSLRPDLCTVPSAIRPLSSPSSSNPDTKRIRALDVGAGIGRVTADVLLHLVSDVVLLEPVESFVKEAWARGQASTKTTPLNKNSKKNIRWKGIADESKSVTFFQGTLQVFNPVDPVKNTTLLGRVGYVPTSDDSDSAFDVVWCQWCLGHLSDDDLVDFLRRSRKAFRGEQSLIVVKENVCRDDDDTSPRTVFDEQDSSLTRSDQAFKKIFRDAGLRLIKEKVQEGLPEGLYDVMMYALR
ncbi:hypothetical protein SERLA73DRAFT_185919 [Serpula lacrymans var. lacrymans S7.3]|uniref:Alpha N-terminal protein methyltransferase 1 n=2 Tax=Serpula lacrymans var. lacrymans TaxID=341189 RepID=F8Q6M7_SERL3|nr:uncharacterized protein SERLADRAFT_474692 [Serpula lacrymans var. lacrymans S7.9]EGN96265.1 hypothetical protein SERLA73DRAFT_185919 [Serpula lacrymans var. lacrymans S7.3]EGO21804.1 hypothetical protein SERLADRAFT_474692 [Serpula lacrymans var. lacrymans S7.9]